MPFAMVSKLDLRTATLLGLVLSFGSAVAAGAQENAVPGVCYASTGFEGDSEDADPNLGGRLLIVDLATGAASLVGPSGVAALGGLAIDSAGRIYATDPGDGEGTSTLWRIDAASGAATAVGDTGLLGVDAIAFDDQDVLYAAESFGQDALHIVDVTDASAQFVGNFGLGETEDEILGMAFDPVTATMYGSAGSHSDNLYTIDRSSGEATLVGSTGLGGAIPDLAFDAEGNLFASRRPGRGGEALAPAPQGEEAPAFELISIDAQTGAGQTIGSTGFTSVSGLSIGGGAAVDFTVDVDDLPDPVTAGSGIGNLTHVVTIYNAVDATNVTVDVTLGTPAGVSVDSVTPSVGSWVSPTWTIPALPAGSEPTLTVVFTVGAATVPGPNVISVSAEVTGASEPIESPTDDSFTQQTTVLAALVAVPSLSATGLAMLGVLLAGAGLLLVRRLG